MQYKRILAVMGKAVYMAETDRGKVVITVPRNYTEEQIQELLLEQYNKLPNNEGA